MREREMQEALVEALYGIELYGDDGEVEVTSVRTFEEAGLMTRNKGVVIRLSDGSSFQLTINKE